MTGWLQLLMAKSHHGWWLPKTVLGCQKWCAKIHETMQIHKNFSKYMMERQDGLKKKRRVIPARLNGTFFMRISKDWGKLHPVFQRYHTGAGCTWLWSSFNWALWQGSRGSSYRQTVMILAAADSTVWIYKDSYPQLVCCSFIFS